MEVRPSRGDRSSGLLPGIDPHGPGPEGTGDRRVQAFCFRMCLTDHPDNRIPFEKPADYDPLHHELLLRNFEAGESGVPWINSSMPNRKTDTIFCAAGAGCLFVCEPAHHVVLRQMLGYSGATITSRRHPDDVQREFLASEDSWFRPVMARTGPDGALYVVDMYRLVLEHRAIFDPNRAVEQRYTVTTFVLDNVTVASGLVVADAPAA
jgi:hypothetical protein